MSSARRLLLGVTLAAAASAPGPAGAGPPSLMTLLRQEKAILDTLEAMTGRIDSTEAQLDDLGHEHTQLTYQLTEARRRSAALERRFAERRSHLRRGVRRLYKLDRGGLGRLIFDDSAKNDLSARLSAARLILRRDVRELEIYHDERARLAQEQQALEGKLERSQQLRRALQAQLDTLRQTQAEKLRLLRQARRSREARHRSAGALDAQARTLLWRVNERSWQLHRRHGFAARRGRLPAPVSGSVASRAGAPVRNTTGRSVEVIRHGVTFRPTRRAAVKAVAPGVVRLAAPLAGYGEIVLIEHAGGYHTLYGFLDACLVRAGQQVQTGETLGRAGSDPLTGRPGTYFEIRRGERPLNPVAWLRR
jgi:septal ring factor EnvC (AmiA/AmiB activator)